MENIMACRICLGTGVKLYEMCKYRLKTAYENVTGLSVCNRGYPQHVCSFCGIMLYRFTEFQARCHRSEKVLADLHQQNELITTSHIKSLDLQQYNISLPYTKNLIQNFDTTVSIKDENEFTSDNCELNTDDCNLLTESYNHDLNVDKKSPITIREAMVEKKSPEKNVEKRETNNYDSDEEPLAKKVKRKSKKRKKCLRPLKSQTMCDKTEVKCEKIDDYTSNNQLLTLSDNNYTISDKDYTISDKDYTISDNKHVMNDTDNDDQQNQMPDLVANHELTILTVEEQIKEVLDRKTSSNYLNSFYKCESCYKGFMTEATYNNHMVRHDPCSGPVVCAVCAVRCKHPRALRAHTLIAHQRRYTCKMCGHISKSSHKAKEHYRWHAGVRFECSECGAVFSRSTSYLTHRRVRHASRACALCHHSFLGEAGLNLHRKRAHSHQNVESVHLCDGCNTAFRSTEALARHADLTAGFCDTNMHVCSECGDHHASDTLLKEHTHMHQHKSTPAPACPQCSRTFAHARSLAAHIARAHGARSAPAHRVCEHCGYTCMSGSSLANHLRTHTGEKPFACNVCPKRFSVTQRLQIHMRSHTGERPFQCTHCPKAFKHKAALNRHDRVHTGVKPYACAQCGKRFSQSNSLKQHLAGVHWRETVRVCSVRQAVLPVQLTEAASGGRPHAPRPLPDP